MVVEITLWQLFAICCVCGFFGFMYGSIARA